MMHDDSGPDPVRMTAFDREVDIIGEQVKRAVDDTIDSGWYVLGEQVDRFEARFSDFVDCRHGIGVNSGTDALVLGLRALGVGSGDEVITVSHTATATAAAVVQAGAEPVYADVHPEAMVMDPRSVEEAITPETSAVVPVHLYGQPAPMDPLVDVASDYDVPVLGDCAQAHGAMLGDRPVGSLGDIAAFSFYPTKNLGAYGDAGMVTTNDADLATDVDRRRQYGWIERDDPTGPGQNSRLDELQAAVLNVKMDRLEKWNDRRRRNAAIYDDWLAATPVQRPPRTDESRHVFHQYVIRTDERDALAAHLDAHGIQNQVHYPTPVHQQTGYESDVSLPVTEELSGTILSLPVHPFLEEAEIGYVADTILNFFD